MREGYIIKRVCMNCKQSIDKGDVRESYWKCRTDNKPIRKDGYCKRHEWDDAIKKRLAEKYE